LVTAESVPSHCGGSGGNNDDSQISPTTLRAGKDEKGDWQVRRRWWFERKRALELVEQS
jgi:hypothetical protein